MSYSEISENTQLNEKELNKTVQSLVDVKMLEQSEQVYFDLYYSYFSTNLISQL